MRIISFIRQSLSFRFVFLFGFSRFFSILDSNAENGLRHMALATASSGRGIERDHRTDGRQHLGLGEVPHVEPSFVHVPWIMVTIPSRIQHDLAQ